MNEAPAKPKSKVVEPKKQTRRKVSLSRWIVSVAVVMGLFVGIGYSSLSNMRHGIDGLKAALVEEQGRSDALSEQLAAQMQTIEALSASVEAGLSGNVSQIEKQYIGAASARLEATVAREIAALGTSGFRFNMVEFDRRSCALGGTFTGEHPDGYQQNHPFEKNNMVEVLESAEDVRGVPFYRIKINGASLQWQGSPAIFRHGSMRIECN